MGDDKRRLGMVVKTNSSRESYKMAPQKDRSFLVLLILMMNAAESPLQSSGKYGTLFGCYYLANTHCASSRAANPVTYMSIKGKKSGVVIQGNESVAQIAMGFQIIRKGHNLVLLYG